MMYKHAWGLRRDLRDMISPETRDERIRREQELHTRRLRYEAQQRAAANARAHHAEMARCHFAHIRDWIKHCEAIEAPKFSRAKPRPQNY